MGKDGGDLIRGAGAFVPVPQPGWWPELSRLGRFLEQGKPVWEAAASALCLRGQNPDDFNSFKSVLSANKDDD